MKHLGIIHSSENITIFWQRKRKERITSDMLSIKFHQMCFTVLVTLQLSKLYEKHSHQCYGQPTSVLKTRSSTGTKLYNSLFKTHTKLFSQTRMFLQIAQNGKVGGTVNCSSQFVQLEISTIGLSLVRIKGVKSGRYLAMNSAGHLYSSVQANDETVFKSIFIKSNQFRAFSSNKYYQRVLHDTYVGIRKNGKAKNGRRTNKSQKPVHFLMLPQLYTTC